MKKQPSISSFFKPKNSNEKSVMKKKITPKSRVLEEKENLNSKIKDIKLNPVVSIPTDDEEETVKVKKRRKVLIDSSDEEDLPKQKKPRNSLNRSENIASSDEEDDEDANGIDNSDSDSGSALGSDISDGSSKISDSELDFLRADGGDENIVTSSTKSGRRVSARMNAKIEKKKTKGAGLLDRMRTLASSESEDEQKPSTSVKKSRPVKKETKLKPGERADNEEDEFPFEEPSSSQEESKTEPKLKSPKKEHKPPMSEKIKSNKNLKTKVSPKKEFENPMRMKESPDKKNAPVFTNKTRTTGPVKHEDFNPSKSKYDPVNDACWEAGSEVPYFALAKTLALCEDNSGRLAKTEYLANFLRSVDQLSPNDLLPAVHLSLNLLAAAYEGVELGIGDFILIKAIAQATGRSTDKIKKDMNESGDLGSVAENSKGMQKMMFQPKPMKLSQVYKKLQQVAAISGGGNQQKKIDLIKSCLVACKGPEARFLIRSCTGKLRIGVSEASVLSAIAWAFHCKENNDKFNKDKFLVAEAAIKTAFCELPNYDILLKTLQETGLKDLDKRIQLAPGVPLKPMLAHPTKDMSEILKRFGDDCEFTAEYKYDGERAQIHVHDDGTMSIFSRNQENNTTKYPDIINRMPNAFVDVKSAIIDSECVAWDPEKKQILPFQVLTTRKKKDVDEKDIKVQVCVYAFDLLYLNGESLVREPLGKRRDLLRANFKTIEGEFLLATSKDFTSLEDVSEFLDEAVKDSTEGLMVKSLNETYEISKRSHNWLKLKKDYLGEGVGDSIDLVVIGGYSGKGKRTGTYGGFLLACYNPDEEEYQSICKIGTGFTDENLEKFTTQLKEHVCPKKSYYTTGTISCDFYFEPEVVWEVKCADLSISPVHSAAAGLVDEVKGISLRFPRFIRVRDDKKAEDATTADQIAEMYNSQDVIKNNQPQ